MLVNARECKIKPVSHAEYKEFCEVNHRQGYARASVMYGLFLKEELVQLMAFGRPRFNNWYQYEIVRDCTKKGYSVRGGVSKLWKHFLSENKCNSCICYSHPHEDSLFVDKYIKYCGFTNIKKAKPGKNLYFEGFWDGETRIISKSLLEAQGVDRLLGGKFGNKETNEGILDRLGFVKKYEYGFSSPQVDIYFPFGVVYRIDDLNDGTFYIGETLNKEKWEGGYLGSGTLWLRHLNKHKDHKYKRTVILNATTPKEMFEREVEEINKYCVYKDSRLVVDHSTGCLNIDYKIHGNNVVVCPECNGVNGMHKKDCIYAVRCPECGLTNNNHLRTCSRCIICPGCGAINNLHKRECSLVKNVCSECGGVNGHHKKECSKVKICPECGGADGKHKSGCSKKKVSVCEECGSSGNHKKWCSKYKEPEACEECGSTYGHKSSCSKYKRTVCGECGGIGNHKKTCSKYTDRKACPECGGSSGNHKKHCSKYKPLKACPECGSPSRHKSWCSKHKSSVEPCEICGGLNGRHKSSCTEYKRKKCPHCGSYTHHKKGCPNYKDISVVCEECGGKNNNHKKTCSKYVIKLCPECGSPNGHHKKSCSKFVERKGCEECGSLTHHKEWCSKRKKRG